MKALIIGGVAAGASAAARLRRLDESADIVLIERGDAISYANCGLPYHLGGVIEQRSSLLVMAPEAFRRRFAVDVRTQTEAVAIDRKAKTVTLRTRDGLETTESYDRLLLATGASPVSVPIDGLPAERTMTLTTLPEMDRTLAAVAAGAASVLVVGGGFIGVEAAENLARRGLKVTLTEKAPQVLSAVFDSEMTPWIHGALKDAGVELCLGRTAVSWSDGVAVLDDGSSVAADVVLMCIGVRPNSALAEAAGLEIGPRGHIHVSPTLQTSDSDIFAAGDAVEIRDPLTGGTTAIALAGPANRQGRIAAGNMLGQTAAYFGTYGTSVVKTGALTTAGVGMTERRALAAGLDYRVIYAHPMVHAAYYPGGEPIHMKLIVGTEGTLLGAQAVGPLGTEKRVDVIATAMRLGAKACDLTELELCYAPPYGAAKDPVNMLGFIACNIRDGLTDPVKPSALPADAFLLDVREPEEVAQGTIPGSTAIPLGQLRSRLDELPRDRTIVSFCKVGQRGYYAERILKQAGFRAANLSGGFGTWSAFRAAGLL